MAKHETTLPDSAVLAYNSEDACTILGNISKVTLWRLVKAGQLTSYRVGKNCYYDAADLKAYWERAKAKALEASRAA